MPTLAVHWPFLESSQHLRPWQVCQLRRNWTTERRLQSITTLEWPKLSGELQSLVDKAAKADVDVRLHCAEPSPG